MSWLHKNDRFILKKFINIQYGIAKSIHCSAAFHNGIKSKVDDVEMPTKPTIQDYILPNLNKFQDKISTLCIDTGRSYTFGDLHAKSLLVAQYLKETLKLDKQSAIAIILPNVPEYPIVVLGIIRAGLVATPCNPNYTPNEIKRQLIDSHAQVIFTTKSLIPHVRKATDENSTRRITIIAVNTDNNSSSYENVIKFEEIISGTSSYDPLVEPSPEDLAFLPYSSGTTGTSKGVQLTHSNIAYNVLQARAPQISTFEETTNSHQDVVPAFLPFFHIYGLMIVLFQSLITGTKLITMSQFTTERFIKALRKYKANIICGVPSTVQLMINNPEIKAEDLKNLRLIMSGAAPMSASDVHRFLQKANREIDLIQAYGLTEASPLLTMQSSKISNSKEIGGSGILVPNTSAKVIAMNDDPTSNLEDLGPNKSGEIIVKGPQVMKGYLNKPDATRDVLVGNGWLKTGDIGHYNENGELFITDRLKELIKVKGFQVAPAELEGLLRDHPDVLEAAVVGIPHERFGEAPKAFVVKRPKAQVNHKDLQQFIEKQVSGHKKLEGGVVFIESIPKNPSGKILRRELKKL